MKYEDVVEWVSEKFTNALVATEDGEIVIHTGLMLSDRGLAADLVSVFKYRKKEGDNG